jgi:hypothetical protein
LDSLDDAVDLCFAFNLRPASQHPDRASPEEEMLETHLTFDVVCQATVNLLCAHRAYGCMFGEGAAGRTYDLAAHGRHVLSLQFWHSYTDW